VPSFPYSVPSLIREKAAEDLTRRHHDVPDKIHVKQGLVMWHIEHYKLWAIRANNPSQYEP